MKTRLEYSAFATFLAFGEKANVSLRQNNHYGNYCRYMYLLINDVPSDFSTFDVSLANFQAKG